MIVALLDQAEHSLTSLVHGVGGGAALAGALDRTASAVEELDRRLRGRPGARAVLSDPRLGREVEERLAALERRADAVEHAVDTGEVDAAGSALEDLTAALLRLRDSAWAVRRDRLGTAAAVARLAGARAALGDAALDAYLSLQTALSALDRLEVRGRDSAGIHVLVSGHGLDLAAPEVGAAVAARSGDPLFPSLAVRAPLGHLSFVYKAASEIGELGDNTRALRAAIEGDDLLGRALASGTAAATVVGHTRWASVGVVSEANAHPLNQEEEGLTDGPYVTAALNGDIDNHAELGGRAGVRIPLEFTTDAKLVPVLVSRAMAGGLPPEDALRTTAASFQGSVAIAANAAEVPDRVLLALQGGGQALYVGLAEDAYVVASEPYGVIGETGRYLRMDGEAPVRGQIVVLDRAGAGTLAGVRRRGYDGVALPVAEGEVRTAEMTTRDVDRGSFPHYLLKEISEAPQALRKTLRGRVVERDGHLEVGLGDDALPDLVRRGLRSGAVHRVVAIGQGTAAVAAAAAAAAVADAVVGSSLSATAMPATELSGFGLRDDMGDTLVVALSQSGTTTDTNRTVDLVRARGALVVAVVNRRGSDLAERAHGVLYTSDGRDVEMSVASTKAFYAQVAAGFLLAEAIADAAGCPPRPGAGELLAGLRQLPEAMSQVLARRPQIAELAGRHAPPRRSWAVVGSGPNRVAAQEIRIKLSELCYKSIACDATEDKKHIDLSSEPLVLVCAAGMSGSNADDVAKEVAIYRAHKAAPIVVANDGDGRFGEALGVVGVPAVHPRLAFVLSAMVGHLFGYEAALAIDAQATLLRQARGAVESAVSVGGDAGLEPRLALALAPVSARILEGLRSGAYDGHLEASTAIRLVSLLRYGTGALPLQEYQLDHGKVGTPSAVVEDLINVLTRGIEELTRPVDAIKHQAKTVTVGISRSEEALFAAPLVRAVLAAGVGRDHLSYHALRTLAALGPAVAEVTGHTRYRIEGDLAGGIATVHVEDKGGVAAALASRTERDPTLRGTKHRAAAQREVTVARGHDGRVVVIVPEVKDNQATGITLLHARFAGPLPPATARTVLAGYQGRLDALVDAVTEVEPTLSEEVLGQVGIADLLTEPVRVLAERWRAT